jgi:hypothetical protein
VRLYYEKRGPALHLGNKNDVVVKEREEEEEARGNKISNPLE